MQQYTETINFAKTRSFWAAFLAGLTGLAQVTDANFLVPLASLLEMIGFIDSADELVATVSPFFASIAPMATAALGIWAYVERLLGTKKVVLGRSDSYPPHGGQP